MEHLAYANYVVIAVTCWFSYQGFRSVVFEENYIFWPEAILARREYYRLITSAGLHESWFHLGMNMLSLYFFGPLIEDIYGPVEFLGIYLASIVGGDLLSLFLHRHHDYRAYGASGGVCGIIYAFIMLFPGSRIMPIMGLPFSVPSWLYAICFLALSFYGMKSQKDNIGHDAHLGGALVGLFTAAMLHPDMIRHNLMLFIGISIGTAALFVYLAKNPLFLPLRSFEIARRRGPTPAVTPRDLDKEVDAILQKISEHGASSLTAREKALLQEASDKYQRRGTQQKPESGLIL